MPQQSTPRNTTQEEAAGVPSSVVTPTFAIPPHLMGRNVDNPAEDMIGSGRKLQKPRLGVRVPYRNLTSQIVTQDEIAQELLERSLKKHPVHDAPEGGDLFFAMKLTQRLANRLSPSAGVNLNISHEIETITGKSGHFQQSTDTNCLLPPGYTLVPESTAIPDHGDLLAILDGDADWVPDGRSTVDEIAKRTSAMESNKPPPLMKASSSIVHLPLHHHPPKLDPLIEREMALKQLKELPIRSRKKKNVEGNMKGNKQQKTKIRGKKVILETKKLNKQDSENNNRASVNGKVGTDLPSNQKPGRKRKLGDKGDANTKIKKKRTNISENQSIGNNKTDVNVKKPKISKNNYAQKKQNNNSVLNNGVAQSMIAKRKKVISADLVPTCSVSSASNLNTPMQKSQDSDKNVNLLNEIDDFPDSLLQTRKFKTPPRTYSPRKRVIKPGNSPNISPKQNIIAAMLVKEIGKTLSECSSYPSRKSEGNNKINISGNMLTRTVENVLPSTSNEGLTSKYLAGATIKDVTPKNIVTTKTVVSVTNKSANTLSGKTASQLALKTSGCNTISASLHTPNKNTVSVPVQSFNDPKRRRMTEIDRLFMDEGAINLLYEVEQGDAKRRSGPPEPISSNLKTKIRSPLKSIRRQKKDLLLKTRLVKSAVLRLSNLKPSPSAAVALRARRQIGPPILQLATGHKQDRLHHRKQSLDSRDSLRSPPPLTPVDPPSPQTFSFPPRLHLTAEASRIIRRHSSSSTFSSRSASPNLQHRSSIDTVQLPENTENKPDNHYSKSGVNMTASGAKGSSDIVYKKRAEIRKKGVPIFVRKLEATQTYKGKKKKDKQIINSDTLSNVLKVNPSAAKLLEMKCKELKIQNKSQVDVNKKTVSGLDSKKKTSIMKMNTAQTGTNKKMSSAVKLKLKTQMSKNFQKGLQKGKLLKIKKTTENSLTKMKKKDEIKDKTDKDENMPDLTSCLAAVASQFAAETDIVKKVAQLRRTSHDSSLSSQQGSKSPIGNQPPPLLRKEIRDIPPPLSPNASSYSSLIKTLETESQRQKKKEDEVMKQRSSVRQNAGTYHYKEICLRRYDNLVQIILTPASTKMKNSLNLQVLRELKEALNQLKRDEGCRVVLMTSAGSSFCQGIDFHSLLHTNADKRKTAAQELAQALKEFLKSLALFSKPLVAGVHGAAVGLGVTMLPFFDMVFASDKATFYTPYAKLGQVPEGAAILTLPHMLGNAVTSELLFGCRKLTASEALHFGLVTRILWPDRFQEELIPIIRSMANQSAQSMEATKALLRHSLRTKLEAALDSEVPLLVQHWISAECQANFRRFLDDEDVGLQRQRMDA